MRMTRNKTKRTLKDLCRRHQRKRPTDGPQCPYCEPRVNGIFNRRTLVDRQHSREMLDSS